MSDSSDPLAWVARAEEDYGLARIAVRHKPPFCYGTCFHAQQCAEKYLKAILVSRHHAFPKTHDLRLLENLCTSAGILVPVDNTLLDTLSSYAVRIRYPGDDPTLDEAKEAQKIAKAVRRFARKLLGLKL